jgi:hypothetical protein
MRSVILRGALALSLLGLGVTATSCQRHEGEESQEPYEDQGGGRLPEGARGGPNEGVPMNVETGKTGGRLDAPGRQQENRYQAGAERVGLEGRGATGAGPRGSATR